VTYQPPASSQSPIERFRALKTPPDDATSAWFRQRGYALESLLGQAFQEANLDPTLSYKAKGEQIDGSFVLDGRVVLIEAKWTADLLPASSIFAFKGKVDGKLVGTIGMMIAVNGFSDDAHDALRFGKDLNVLLMDGDDLEVALDIGIAEAMRLKVRAAADRGLAYLNLAPVRGAVRTPRDPQPGVIEGSAGPRLIEFIVEGRTDAIIVQTLAKRILQGRGDYDVLVQIAGGKLNIPAVANGSTLGLGIPHGRSAYRQIIVADGDGDPESTQQILGQALDRPAPVIVIEPSIEQWFADGGRELSAEALRYVARTRGGGLETFAASLDLALLRAHSESFQAFEAAVLGEPLADASVPVRFT